MSKKSKKKTIKLDLSSKPGDGIKHANDHDEAAWKRNNEK